MNSRGAVACIELRGQAAREPHPLALDVAPGVLQQLQRVRRVVELDAHLLEDRVGVVLDELEALLAQHLERRHRARDVRDSLGARRAARGLRAARPPPCRPRRPSGASSLTRCSSRRWRSGASRRRRRGRRRHRRGPGAGSSIVAASRGNGSDVCGMPIAATKCSWNRGSTAVSSFSTRRTTPSISPRAARLSSAIRAPVPAALPALVTRAGSQSGTRPSTNAYVGSMCAPNAPASRIRSTVSMPKCVHQQAAAGVQRGLRELDLADVVLGDHQSRRPAHRAARRRTCARRVGSAAIVRRVRRRSRRRW